MRKRRYEEPENEVQLNEVLEPYGSEPVWEAPPAYPPQEENPYDAYDPDAYVEEYSDEHEEADHEGRFRIAMGMFNLISILVGIVVILMLVAVLVTLFNWLRSDILHSALLLQSGLQ